MISSMEPVRGGRGGIRKARKGRGMMVNLGGGRIFSERGFQRVFECEDGMS